VLAVDAMVLVLALDAAVPPPVDDSAVGVELLPPQAASRPPRTPAAPPAASPRSTVLRLNVPLGLAPRPRSSLIILPPPNDAIDHTPHAGRASRSVRQTTADGSASITLLYDVRYGVGGTLPQRLRKNDVAHRGSRICLSDSYPSPFVKRTTVESPRPRLVRPLGIMDTISVPDCPVNSAGPIRGEYMQDSRQQRRNREQPNARYCNATGFSRTGRPLVLRLSWGDWMKATLTTSPAPATRGSGAGREDGPSLPVRFEREAGAVGLLGSDLGGMRLVGAEDRLEGAVAHTLNA